MSLEEVTVNVKVNATSFIEKIEKLQESEDMLPSDLEKFLRENIEVLIIASPDRRTICLDLNLEKGGLKL